MLGYAALAQALGMVKGGSQGRLDPGGAVTRGDAAMMLLAFMERA